METLKRQFLDVMWVYLHQENQYVLYCIAQSYLIFYRVLSFVPSYELTTAQASNLDKRNGLLKRLVQFVDNNYTSKIRLSDFARAEGYTVSYLSHYIKNSMNQTFQEYVTAVRLNCARNMIADGGKRLLDICMESGFSDYRYFCKAFRSQYNMTPEEYRCNGGRDQGMTNLRSSIHSEERIYSVKESLEILNRLSK